MIELLAQIPSYWALAICCGDQLQSITGWLLLRYKTSDVRLCTPQLFLGWPNLLLLPLDDIPSVRQKFKCFDDMFERRCMLLHQSGTSIHWIIKHTQSTIFPTPYTQPVLPEARKKTSRAANLDYRRRTAR